MSTIPPGPLGSTTRIVEATNAWALATRGRLVVSVWRSEVTVAQVSSVDRTIRALLPRCAGRGYGSISVIEPGISMHLSDDARIASTELQRRHAEQMMCSGYLVEGTGFLPAVVRTLTAGIHLVTRSPYPIKVFARLPDLASWVAPHVDLDDAEIARVVHAVREAGLAER